LQLSLRL